MYVQRIESPVCELSFGTNVIKSPACIVAQDEAKELSYFAHLVGHCTMSASRLKYGLSGLPERRDERDKGRF